MAEDGSKENKESDSVSIPVGKYLDRFRKNPWIVSTVVLGIALIVFAVLSGTGGLTGNVINEGDAGAKLVDFINSQGGEQATLLSISEESGMYKVTVLYQNQSIPVYVTKDGKLLVTSTIPLASSASSSSSSSSKATEVPKSDKPVADFYVFSYCPNGTQMEKALVPVYNLLKNKADINIVFIGAMHGEFEHVESLRQICIENNYGEDKLFDYLNKFLVNADIGNCQGTDSCVNPLVEAIFTQIGVDKNKINTCMASSDTEAAYQEDVQKAKSLGITGSPSVVINGVETQVGRSPSLVQQAICSAFNTAPAECSTQLSATTASAGFGSTGSSSSSGSC